METARPFAPPLTQLGLTYVVGVESNDDGLGARTTTFAGPSAKTWPWGHTQAPANATRNTNLFR